VLVRNVPASKNLPSVTRSFDREISNDFAKSWLGPAWELPSNLVRHEWMAFSGPSLFNLFFGQLKHLNLVYSLQGCDRCVVTRQNFVDLNDDLILQIIFIFDFACD
jgi:hypothetical protein